jgi:hypothetical protein
MPTMMDNLLAWCRTERVNLQRQLELMESGIMRTGEYRAGSPPRDTTTESIDRVRHSIIELDQILARRSDA